MILKTLTLAIRIRSWKTIESTTKSVATIGNVLLLMKSIHSGRMKLAPLAPFMTKK